MVSHDYVAGHGREANHAIGMAGSHWTHCKHCPVPVRKGTTTCCVGVSALDIGHWHWHVQCIQRPLDICRMVTGNGLALHPNFFEREFCLACLCWALASGHCTCRENFHGVVGNWEWHWTYVFAAWPLLAMCVGLSCVSLMVGHRPSGFAAAQW